MKSVIYLQIPAVLSTDGILQLLNVHGVNDVRQTEMLKNEPLVPEPRPFDV